VAAPERLVGVVSDTHGLLRPELVKALQGVERIAAAGFHAVVSGHSHQPKLERRDGVLYLNPGSIGPRRFKLPIAFALLRVTGLVVEAKIVEL